jgi:hypothetical protein
VLHCQAVQGELLLPALHSGQKAWPVGSNNTEQSIVLSTGSFNNQSSMMTLLSCCETDTCGYPHWLLTHLHEVDAEHACSPQQLLW